MKKYIKPEIREKKISVRNVIATSPVGFSNNYAWDNDGDSDL